MYTQPNTNQVFDNFAQEVEKACEISDGGGETLGKNGDVCFAQYMVSHTYLNLCLII